MKIIVNTLNAIKYNLTNLSKMLFNGTKVFEAWQHSTEKTFIMQTTKNVGSSSAGIHFSFMPESEIRALILEMDTDAYNGSSAEHSIDYEAKFTFTDGSTDSTLRSMIVSANQSRVKVDTYTYTSKYSRGVYMDRVDITFLDSSKQLQFTSKLYITDYYERR